MPLKEFISAILLFAYILSALFITATTSRPAGVALLLPVFGAALFLALREYRTEDVSAEDLSDEVNTEGNTEENRANKRLHFFVRVIWVAILFAVVIGAMSYL
ncbi:MAG: hypothetical protein CMI06_06460 [Oceanospirillaceae bacterium]|jgi:signal transduction histidine kinase|nr:hypothetical protein [Oceanospirillaceae bacterium]